jgi:hypothetical protein
LTAGRRLRRRRRTGWAVAAAAAVAVVIGVPTIVTRATAPSPRPAVGPSPAPAANGTWPLVFTFEGYSVGDFRVDDPTIADLGSDIAYVHRVGVPSGSPGQPTLRVYHAGVNPTGDYSGLLPLQTNPIGGPAFFVVPERGAAIHLLWQYASNAYAELTADPSAMTEAQMRQVAEAFSPGATRPAQIGFAMDRVPPNYMLVEASGRPIADVTGAPTSGATFVLASAAKAMAAQPDRGVPPEDRNNPDYSLKISLARRTSSDPPLSGTGVTCPAVPAGHPTTCYRLVDQGDRGDFVLTATWAAAGTAPLRAALAGARVVALYDPTTWADVNLAFPAAAQLPG